MIYFNLRALSACCSFTFVLAALSSFAPDIASAQASAGTYSAPPGALAPENLSKRRPKPPFDLTGTWSVDMSKGFRSGLYGPPYPKLTPPAQTQFDAAEKAAREGRVFNDYTGQCYPAGVPMIMIVPQRPIAMIQVPTAIYVISEFQNAVRTLYIDGRSHSDPDVAVLGWHGESVGRWEGRALIVDTKYFGGRKHAIDFKVPVSDEFRITERFTLSADGTKLHIRSTMIDPKSWEGEWVVDKTLNRVNDQDVQEYFCTPADSVGEFRN